MGVRPRGSRLGGRAAACETRAVRVLDPLPLRDRVARNRVLFGPHETNLGRDRSISERHLAYYGRRAAGGAGILVCEEASVHDSDWPYERCPLARECGPGWTALAEVAHRHGALALAAIGHTGGQGSSAYNQQALWAPSGIPEVNTREMPKVMEPEDIDAVVRGFADAADLAVRSGLDGVEVNVGQNSLVRQFLSGLTNLRDDDYGTDRLRFAREVLHAVRAGAGGGIVGLRLSCDELAPWAGIVPEAAAQIADALTPWIDYLVVVRGGIFSVASTRPDGHEPPGFNLDLVTPIHAAVRGRVPVFAQGSIVDIGQAEWAIDDGRCDAVEMTRAQIADADLVNKVAAGQTTRIRPCILCNQTCKVRDARNPIVSCVVDPRSGHEATDADPEPLEQVDRTGHPLDVLVVGAGVAGLECARVAAGQGHRVVVRERASETGGMLRNAAAGAGRDRLAVFADWLTSECEHLGVTIETGVEVTATDIARAVDAGHQIVLGTGSRAGELTYEVDEGATVVTADQVLLAARTGTLADVVPAGPIVIWDPIGGPIAVSVAELLAGPDALGAGAAAAEVTLVTPDLIVGTLLSRSGDLAPGNVRLAGAEVAFVKRAVLREVRAATAIAEDRFTGELIELKAAVVIDAGPLLPDDELWIASGRRHLRVGDAVAPRTVYEAVLEGRRVALGLDGGAS
jgi:mycofactocin system FadH/OYE family oxidoreductase 1